MSDKPIGAGDMVEVIKPSECGCCHNLGFRFVVARVAMARTPCHCLHCGSELKPALSAYDGLMMGGCQLWRLKRVEPDQSIVHEEEHAHA